MASSQGIRPWGPCTTCHPSLCFVLGKPRVSPDPRGQAHCSFGSRQSTQGFAPKKTDDCQRESAQRPLSVLRISPRPQVRGDCRLHVLGGLPRSSVCDQSRCLRMREAGRQPESGTTSGRGRGRSSPVRTARTGGAMQSKQEGAGRRRETGRPRDRVGHSAVDMLSLGKWAKPAEQLRGGAGGTGPACLE